MDCFERISIVWLAHGRKMGYILSSWVVIEKPGQGYVDTLVADVLPTRGGCQELLLPVFNVPTLDRSDHAAGLPGTDNT